MNRFAPCRRVLMLAIVGTLALVAPTIAAPCAYHAKGTAQFISPTEFTGQGQATHLGRYTETGTATFTPTADPAVFDLTAQSTYTAANGDELNATFTGTINFATGVISATATYTGGTGRFANASGSSTLSGQAAPGGPISVTVDGNISY